VLENEKMNTSIRPRTWETLFVDQCLRRDCHTLSRGRRSAALSRGTWVFTGRGFSVHYVCRKLLHTIRSCILVFLVCTENPRPVKTPRKDTVARVIERRRLLPSADHHFALAFKLGEVLILRILFLASPSSQIKVS